jgi:adenosylhomocysteinase
MERIDPGLAREGKVKIDFAETRMPVLRYLTDRYKLIKPIQGKRIAACLHITKETAMLMKALSAAGAEISLSGSNPLSTQDDIAAALTNFYGIGVWGWRGQTAEEYFSCIESVLGNPPHITMDDGADLTVHIHNKYTDLIEGISGGTEETTTGIQRLTALADAGKLTYPIIAVNNAETKWDFDNVYGTGQSVLDGIMRATNILIAGTNFVVAGYGHCGRGIAMRARGLGAHVIVTEVNPVNALKAVLDGFDVMPMLKAAKIGDVFVTATGCKDVITAKHMKRMKDGAILANAGHFNVEVSVGDLERLGVRKREVRPNNVKYELEDGRRIFLLGEGRLVNLVAADGHPPEVMDMSFANQFLSVLHLIKRGKRMEPKVHPIPREQDEFIARIKLSMMGKRIDRLSGEQERYIRSYESTI